MPDQDDILTELQKTQKERLNRMGKKIGFVLISVLLAIAGFTFYLWFPPLIIFMGANGELVQSFSGLIQIIIWAAMGFLFWFGLLKGRQMKSGSKVQPKVEAHDKTVVVQGNHNNVVGSDGVLVDGQNNTVIKDSFNTNYQEKTKTKPKALTQDYLNYLYETVCDVSLVGIDRSTANDAEARVNLGTVYTALETFSQRSESMGKRSDLMENERQPVLEHLNHYPRLVLLGDPGSGKSTFVNFVVLCLASEGLKMSPGLQGFAVSLEEQDKRDKKQKKVVWELGNLLPYRVILRDFASSKFLGSDEKECTKNLCAFIQNELSQAGLADFSIYLFKIWHESGGLLLLDGLDEVPEADEKRSQIKKVVEDFSRAFSKCRILVTSRTYAYQKQEWNLKGFESVVLAPFNQTQIKWFIDHWYKNIAQIRHQKQEDCQARAILLKNAIFGSDRLIGLAERPLLLTLMASLHAWRGGNLPEKREELYSETVDLMLVRWEDQRIIRGKNNEIKLIQPSLAEWMRSDRDQIRNLLNELAFRVHAGQTELKGTADIPEKELVDGLMKINKNPDVNPVRLVEYLSDRAGLLLPRGVGVYTFPHRTFQEYLAACHLTELDYPVEVVKLAYSDPERWREVVLLAGAKAGGRKGSSFALWALVDELCPVQVDDPLTLPQAWGSLFAGQAIIETVDYQNVTGNNLARLDRVKKRLLALIQLNSLPALERTRAGDTLAKLGDPRFNPQMYYLPEEDLLGFVRIPAGEFIMGSDPLKDKEASKEEQPQHKLLLPEFYMARYPVTVAQFRIFMEQAKYKPQDDDCLKDLPTRPVRWVTWDDAMVYCQWLDGELRKQTELLVELENKLKEGWFITLPNEAQWEKAARGTDGWIYPWGDELGEDHANYEMNVGNTSVVGSYLSGASPYGILDMSGNVWEWTCSLWGKDPQKPEFGYPYLLHQEERENLKADMKVLRVVRGGAFFNLSWVARCAFRGGDDPLDWDLVVGFRIILSPPSS